MKYCAVLIALLLGSCTEPPPPPGPPPQMPVRELAGRFSGRPQSCVPIEQIESLRVSDADRHLLLYGSGRTVWVNHLGPACSFNPDDVLVTHPFGSSYCRGDIVRSFDRFSRIPGPACVLSDWVPYNIR
jgi:hypothetical protein